VLFEIDNVEDFIMSPLDASDRDYDKDGSSTDNSIDTELIMDVGSHPCISTYYYAMEADLNGFTHYYYTSIRMVLNVPQESDLPVLEIWSDNTGSPKECIYPNIQCTTPGTYGSLTEFKFDIDNPEFLLSCLDNDDTIWIVLKIGESIDWGKGSIGGNGVFGTNVMESSNSGTSWSTTSTPAAAKLNVYIYHLDQDSGDGLTNYEEYIVGTNPKRDDTDDDTGTQSTKDGDEVSDKVIFETTIEDGALGYWAYEGETLTGEVIWYDTAITGNRYKYVYSSSGAVGDSTVCLRLADDTEVRITDSKGDLYVGKTGETYYKFTKSGGLYKNMESVPVFRGREIYFSDPWREDSDLDNATDSEEIDWDGNYDEYSGQSEIRNLIGYDLIVNIRDDDSDNDGILDGDEVNYNSDETGLGLDTDTDENMIDLDSDGDGLWDGFEIQSTYDFDIDGLLNVVDPDSDGDGLCDGYADGYIWDPLDDTVSTNYGYYRDFSTINWVSEFGSAFPHSETAGFDIWEGEDKDCDGNYEVDEDEDSDDKFDIYYETEGYVQVYNDYDSDGYLDIDDFENGAEGTDWEDQPGGETVKENDGVNDDGDNKLDRETDPASDDTDEDGLKDGYDIVYDPTTPTWKYGEYYYKEFKETRTYLVEQDDDTDPLEIDTDGDGLYDMGEINNQKTFYVWKPTNPSSPTLYENQNSDPSVADTDGDNLNDGDEYIFSTSPLETDTDSDGITDYIEWDTGSMTTRGDHFDSDNDNLPDGRVENWWCDSSGNWEVATANEDGNAHWNVWEGEDLDGDGTIDTNEDLDGDGYFDVVISTVHYEIRDDTDGDGLLDLGDTMTACTGSNDEDDGTTSNNGNGYLEFGESDPDDIDSDDDCIIDGWEYFFDMVSPDWIGSRQYLKPWQDAKKYDASTFNTDSASDDNNNRWFDVDGSGGPNAVDSDADGDSVTDSDEVGPDGTLDATARSPKGTGTNNDYYTAAMDFIPFVKNSDGDGVDDTTDWLGAANRVADFDRDGLICTMDRDSDADLSIDNSPDTTNGNAGTGANVDNDGLTDAQERVNRGTSDTNADSDGDSIDDGTEVNTYGSNSMSSDSDGDGAGDGAEVSAGSSLMDSDTDDDGLPDGNPFELAGDTDGDGDPNYDDTDSDGDGIADGDEDKDGNGFMNGDTDNDYKICSGEIWKETNPTKIDSDGDGLPDGWIDGWNYWRNKYTGEAKWGLSPDYVPDPGKPTYEDYVVGPLFHQGTFVDNVGEVDYWEGEDLNRDGKVNTGTFTVPWPYNQIITFSTESDPKTQYSDSDSFSDGFEKSQGFLAHDSDTDHDGVNDDDDYEPNVKEQKLELNIFEINDLDGDLDQNDAPDIRVDVTFDELLSGQWESAGFSTKSWDRNKYNVIETKTFISEVLDPESRWIRVKIKAYDHDYFNGNEIIDITPKKDYCTLVLYFDMETSLWNGGGTFTNKNEFNTLKSQNIYEGMALFKPKPLEEDFNTQQIRESNNQVGYCTGDKDGKYPADGDIFFDVKLHNSFDEDGLSWFSEFYYWKTRTSPVDWNTDGNADGFDSDQDGMDDGWEVIHSMKPINSPFDIHPQYQDTDNDGIYDLYEYIHNDYGLNPNRDDILVEIDTMDTCYLYLKTIFHAVEQFQVRGFSIHIDYGDLGGGQVVPSEASTNSNDFGTYYNNYFLKSPDGSSNLRKGKFHYAVIANEANEFPKPAGWSNSPGTEDVDFHKAGMTDMFFIFSELYQSGTFMHELGHNIIGFVDETHQFHDESHCEKFSCTMYWQGILINSCTYCDRCWDEIIYGGNDVNSNFKKNEEGPDFTEGLWEGYP